MAKKDILKDIDDASTVYSKPFFCPFPFKYIYGEQDGKYKLCSEAIASDITSDDMSILDWFSSDYMDSIRSEMVSDTPDYNVLSKSCKICLESEASTGNSTRTNLLKSTSTSTTQNANLYNLTGEYWFFNRPLVVQMRMFARNDTCNLGCYMCFPKFSTIRQRDIASIPDLSMQEEFVSKEKDEDAVQVSRIESVIEAAEHISTLELIGGEPLYIKECFDFVEKLVKKVDCSGMELSIFTNLSVLSNKGKNFLDYTKHFKNVLFKVSFDGIGKYNEYIRKRSVFKDLEENILHVKNSSNCNIFVWTTISMLSILRFDEVEKWCKDKNIRYESNILKDPKMLSIIHLPDPIKEELKIRFSHNSDIVNTLNAQRDDAKFQKAIRYIKSLDKIYKSDVFDLYPELEQYCK